MSERQCMGALVPHLFRICLALCVYRHECVCARTLFVLVDVLFFNK